MARGSKANCVYCSSPLSKERVDSLSAQETTLMTGWSKSGELQGKQVLVQRTITCESCATIRGKLADLDVAIRASGDDPSRFGDLWDEIDDLMYERGFGDRSAVKGSAGEQGAADAERWKLFIKWLKSSGKALAQEHLDRRYKGSATATLWMLHLADVITILGGSSPHEGNLCSKKPVREVPEEKLRADQGVVETESNTNSTGGEASPNRKRGRPINPSVTERNNKIVQQFAEGATNKEVAQEFDITSDYAKKIKSERMALLSSEGGIFNVMSGMYSNNGRVNLDVFLKGHSGDPVRVDRGSRELVNMNNPALTLGLTVQPDVLHGLRSEKSLRGRGVLGRILFSVPKSFVGYRKLDPAPVPPSVEQGYHDMIMRLCDHRGDARKDQGTESGRV